MRSDFGPSSIVFVLVGFFLGMLVMFASVQMRKIESVADTGVFEENIPMLEKDFVENMLKVNDTALTTASSLFISETPKKPELFAFAQHILETRREENRQLRAWLQEWYGIDSTNPEPAAAIPVPAPEESTVE